MKKLIILSTLVLLSFNCWSQSHKLINYSVDSLSCACMKAFNKEIRDIKYARCYQYYFVANSEGGWDYALDSLGNDLYSLRVIKSGQTEVAYQISSDQFHYEVYLFKVLFNSQNFSVQRSARMYFLQTIHNLINN